MKEQLLSAHIDDDGDVIAITKKACYKFKQKLKQPEKLLARITKALEIDTQYWDVEWEYSGVGMTQ